MWCVRACGGDVCDFICACLHVCLSVCVHVYPAVSCVCVPYVLCINGRRGNSIDNALAIN